MEMRLPALPLPVALAGSAILLSLPFAPAKAAGFLGLVLTAVHFFGQQPLRSLFYALHAAGCAGFGIWITAGLPDFGYQVMSGAVLGFWSAALIAFEARFGDLVPGWRIRPVDALWMAVTGATAYGYWGSTLFSAVPFKGDSSFFISASIDFLRLLKSPAAAGFAVMAVAGWPLRNRTWFRLLLPVAAVAAGMFISLSDPELANSARRYLPGYYGLQLLFLADPAVLSDPASLYQYWRFALVPFSATVLLVFSAARVRGEHAHYFRTGVTLLLLTLPALAYFAGLPYGELPALLFFTCSAAVLFKSRQPDAKAFALAVFFAAGALFFKESFLVPAALLGLFALWTARRMLKPEDALSAGAVIFLLPSWFWIIRVIPYSLGTSGDSPGLILPEFWLTGLLSWFEQFGGLAVFALPALLILARDIRVQFAAITAGILIVLMGMDPLINRLFGYARYNLVFLPLLLLVLWAAADRFRNARWLFPAVAALVATGFYLNPIQISNGIRSPGWGDYRFVTSEYDAPYDRVWKRLRDARADSVLFAGRSYHYFDAFYTFKHGISPVVFDTYAGIPDSLPPPPWLVVHSGPGSVPVPGASTAGYQPDTTFVRGAIRLAIWKRSAAR